MPLETGAKLGAYEIVSSIAASSSGEVYKGADPQSNRTVAIEVINLNGDVTELRQPFDRDVQALARLNHSNICVPQELGQQDGVDFVVMDYLEGETLDKRLERGPLKLSEALKAAAEILDALDKAHRAGVVHRNLKPSNVMLTRTGVKLLDFGLGNVKRFELPKPDATAPAPVEGPLNYRAPEQFEEKEIDARADIFAFGSILYEMLSGKKAFEGKSRAVLVASIATTDPDPLSKAAPYAPPALEHILKRCLAKDPDDRWQTVHDLMTQFLWITQGGSAGAGFAMRRRRERVIMALLAALILLAAVLALPASRYWRSSADEDEFRFRVPVRGLSAADVALSPDGQMIALVARPNANEAPALFVRRGGGLAFQRLGGTEDATQPFWSPDSRYIAFVSGSRLKKVGAGGGAPQDLSEVQGFAGGTWSKDGTILFGSKGLNRVSAEGGKASTITTLDPQETGHFWPNFLPDGQHYLYLAWSAQAANRVVFMGKLDSKEKTRLMAAESNVNYAAPGYAIFHRGASLFAQPFDAKKLALSGEPVHIADDVADNAANGRGTFDVSQNGVLMYFQGTGISTGRGRVQPNAQFGWVDRTGKLLESAGVTAAYGDIDLSPDGKQIAVTQQEAGATADIWVIDWQRAAVSTRLTLNSGDNVDPVWSPDGKQVAFTSYRKGNADIYVKNANGVSGDMPLLESPNDEIVKAWSRDGQYIAYLSGQDNFRDIYALPLSGDKKPMPLVQGHFQKGEPQFSYDGKWLAYTSDESGMFQVYVISFPAADQRIQVSMAGGGQPRWKGDGKELYYRSPDNQIMAVDIKTVPRLESSAPHALFNSPRNNTVLIDPQRHQLSVTPDGARFLLMVPPGNNTNAAGGSSPIPAAPSAFAPAGLTGQPAGGVALAPIVNGLTLVQHWTAALGKAVK
jgi:Tol biopolymer transport system component